MELSRCLYAAISIIGALAAWYLQYSDDKYKYLDELDMASIVVARVSDMGGLVRGLGGGRVFHTE